MENKRKFVASYSGGKDSILAIHRMVNQGYFPQLLITTYNTDMERSWFHGIPEKILAEVAGCTGIPIKLIKTSGKAYEQNFEKALIAAKNAGAEMCVFGDMDIEAHRVWCTQRCNNTGLEAVFPLWNESRKKLVLEFIKEGFTANITVVDTNRMKEEYLGLQLSNDLVQKLEEEGTDVCGENGEYHTFVSNGPLFKRKVVFKTGDKVMSDNYAVLPILY